MFFYRKVEQHEKEMNSIYEEFEKTMHKELKDQEKQVGLLAYYSQSLETKQKSLMQKLNQYLFCHVFSSLKKKIR